MARRTRKNVGVLGLGIIGSRVAENLRERGFHVFVWNRNPRPVPNFVGAPAELAEMCDYIQIFVSDDDALLDVVRQMSPALGPRHVVIAHPTVAPHSMRTAADLVERRGARFVEAPFTGSKLGAEKGELVFYVAGDEVALREARPILEASSKEIIEIGEIGQATVVKLATNIATATGVQALAEGLALINHAGIPPEKFVAALQNNASYSKTLAMKLPKMIENNFEPHFALKHMLKDMKIASQLGLSHHLELAVTTAARDRLLEQEQRGYAEEDFSVVARKYFPEMIFPTVEQDLELFEKPPPIEPAATISSMGEVAAAVQEAELTQPMAEPLAQTAPIADQLAPTEPPPTQQSPSPEIVPAAEPPAEQPAPSGSPMDLIAKLLRGESARPDGS
ncbi:MAG TPA: NAD(P)-binding domain-containing protein [Chthoniobacterales bacterium]|nr:NAD(P)-binding domain-containing protein [Chthoniobacterales bacterium]